jgi:hypothetical protein
MKHMINICHRLSAKVQPSTNVLHRTGYSHASSIGSRRTCAAPDWGGELGLLCLFLQFIRSGPVWIGAFIPPQSVSFGFGAQGRCEGWAKSENHF